MKIFLPKEFRKKLRRSSFVDIGNYLDNIDEDDITINLNKAVIRTIICFPFIPKEQPIDAIMAYIIKLVSRNNKLNPEEKEAVLIAADLLISVLKTDEGFSNSDNNKFKTKRDQIMALLKKFRAKEITLDEFKAEMKELKENK